eukprot:scaffold25965_cov73-Phaeocystis_antarctica.AAC.2
MNIAGFGNLVACYCAFDYRWRPVARDKGDPPFSWSLSLCWGSAVRKRSFVTGPINKFVCCSRQYALCALKCHVLAYPPSPNNPS